jgi:hypothetical protein
MTSESQDLPTGVWIQHSETRFPNGIGTIDEEFVFTGSAAVYTQTHLIRLFEDKPNLRYYWTGHTRPGEVEPLRFVTYVVSWRGPVEKRGGNLIHFLHGPGTLVRFEPTELRRFHDRSVSLLLESRADGAVGGPNAPMEMIWANGKLQYKRDGSFYQRIR